MGGDWNARTGNAEGDDRTEEDRYCCSFGFDVLNAEISDRKSKDKVLNKYGKQFLKFVCNLDYMGNSHEIPKFLSLEFI